MKTIVHVDAQACPLYTEMYALLGDQYTMAEYDAFLNMYSDWQSHKEVELRRASM